MKTTLWMTSVLLALTMNAHSQGTAWIAFDTSGTLVDANAGSGTGAVNLNIPANSTRIFLTRSFAPIDVSADGSSGSLSPEFSASVGLDAGEGHNFGIGLFNSAGTETLNDDAGVFGLWDPTGFVELFFRNSGANLFEGNAQGQQGNYSGVLANTATNIGTVRVVNSSGAIRLGDGLANPGVSFSGPSVDQRAYTGNVAGAPQTYDTLAFLFVNNTGTPAVLTVTVPEPSTFAFVGLAFGAAMLRRRSNG